MQITFKKSSAEVKKIGRGSYLVSSDCRKFERAVFVEQGVINKVQWFGKEHIEGQYGREKKVLGPDESYRINPDNASLKSDAEVHQAVNSGN